MIRLKRNFVEDAVSPRSPAAIARCRFGQAVAPGGCADLIFGDQWHRREMWSQIEKNAVNAELAVRIQTE